MIVVDADVLFAVMFKNTLQEALLIPVHTVARGNNKAMGNYFLLVLEQGT